MNFKEKISEINKIRINDFCSQNGIETFGNGNYLKLKEHDSCIIDKNNNTFHWNSRSKNGDLISFVQEYYNLDFKNSVELITGDKIFNLEQRNQFTKKYEEKTEKEEFAPKSTFKLDLDEIDGKYSRLYAYLTKTRKISQETISDFVHRRLISQDSKGNINFKFEDEDKNISYSKKGTTDKKFSYINSGSDIRGFVYKKEDNEKIKDMLIFESPIDLMSYIDIMKKEIDFSDKVLVSMNGLKHNTILKNLQDYENITSINLLVDNDSGGKEFISKIFMIKESNKYPELNQISLSYEVPSNKKDWNELLQKIVEKQEIQKKRNSDER